MGPFEILECVSKVVYRLVLLVSMDKIHNVFHVSLLLKYVSNLTHVLRVDEVELEDNLVYKECLIQILDRQVKKLKNKKIPLVKIL